MSEYKLVKNILIYCLYGKKGFIELLNNELYNSYNEIIDKCIIYGISNNIEFCEYIINSNHKFSYLVYKNINSVLLSNDIYNINVIDYIPDNIWNLSFPSIDFCYELIDKDDRYKYLIGFVSMLYDDTELYDYCNIKILCKEIDHFSLKFNRMLIYEKQQKLKTDSNIAFSIYYNSIIENNDFEIGNYFLYKHIYFNDNNYIVKFNNQNIEYADNYIKDHKMKDEDGELYINFNIFEFEALNLHENYYIDLNFSNKEIPYNTMSAQKYDDFSKKFVILPNMFNDDSEYKNDKFVYPYLPFLYNYYSNDNLKDIYNICCLFTEMSIEETEYAEYTLFILSSKLGHKDIYEKLLEKGNKQGYFIKKIDLEKRKYVNEKISLDNIIPFYPDINYFFIYNKY